MPDPTPTEPSPVSRLARIKAALAKAEADDQRRILAAEVASAKRDLAERRAALKATKRTYKKPPRTVSPPVVFAMRLPALDHARINALAAAAGITPSDYVRDVLAGRRPPLAPNP